MGRWKKGFNVLGHEKNLTLPKKMSWPREPLPILDVTGTSIIIEKGVDISSGVQIFTHSHQFGKSNWRKLNHLTLKGSTIIKKNAFIGTNVIVLYKCKYIGRCSVIGAGSIVTCDIPDYEIWAGIPAKKIGKVKKVKK